MKLNNRNIDVLKIIVEEYINTWEVIWSKLLLKKYNLWVSSATIRNDMSKLEELELVYQPYNSAWRLPTYRWIRAFINYLMSDTPNYFLEEKNITLNNQNLKEISDYTHKISHTLALKTWEIWFFCIPEKNIIQYSWLTNFMKKNFKKMWEDMYMLIDMLEDKFNFSKFIKEFPLHPWVNVFIWEENILNYLKDFSIIIKPIKIDENIWYIWIIWSMQMNYSFNISAVKWII